MLRTDELKHLKMHKTIKGEGHMKIRRDELFGLVIEDYGATFTVKQIIETTDENGNKHYNLRADKTEKPEKNN